MHLFYQPDPDVGHLSVDDSRHAVKVLRLRKADEVELTDGKGKLFSVSITQPDSKKCQFKILKTTSVPRRSFSVHLAVAPTKNMDRMEWMVEKCTELGVEKISFVLCRASERKSLPLDRLLKIAVSALKQSKQAWLPFLSPITPYSEFIGKTSESMGYIAQVDADNPLQLQQVVTPGADCVILIGPEGDFSSEELDLALKNGFLKVGLGPNRLRTETAALAALMTLNLINQK